MPLHEIQAHAGATFMNFGPPPEEGGTLIAQDFGRYPAEYAAIRQRVGIMHLPQRGILRLTGNDRKPFLHNLLTQDIHGLSGGATRRSFQLNHKGRVLADLIVHHGDLDTWLELDRLDLDELHKLLEARLFGEDVTIEDFSEQRVALALHGPAAVALVQALADEGQDATRPANMPGTHHVLKLAGQPVTVYRWDECGVMGLRLMVPTDAAESLYLRLLDAAGFDPTREAEPDADYAQTRRQTLRGRPVGWLAYNTARIEAGTPLFHVDFGHDALPAETGLLEEAVSFTKGCYLGQEIVARMKSLGHPRRVLMGLKFDTDALPVAGTQVFLPPADDQPGRAPGDAVGGVTSSTLSPVLGQVAIAFAVLKWGKHKPGTRLVVPAEGAMVNAEVHELRFIHPA